jgi:arylsulfatase A-like enzyme
MLSKLTVFFTLFASRVTAGDGHMPSMEGIQERATQSNRPNVVFIFTDDQDMRMNSLDFMGGVQKHLIQEGALYQHHYCTVALCCPSRVNLWTGRAAHNTNVTDLSPPYGKFRIN